MKKKNLYQGLIAILISITSMVLLSPKGVNLGNILDQVKNPSFLFLAALSFLCFILMEAWSFKYILKLQGLSLKLGRSYGYSLVDYFFSSLSPGGSAGQPAQLYYMSQDKIGIGQALMSLIVFNTIYHLAMVVFALVSQISLYHVFLTFPLRIRLVMAYGVLMQLGLTIFQGSLMISQKRVPALVQAFMKKMRDWKIPILKNISEEKVSQNMDQYKANGAYFKKRPEKLLPIFMGQIFLLIFSYSIAYFIYRSLGYDHLSYMKTVEMQSQLIIATESLPLPGGVGASEDFFYQVYQAYVPQNAAFTWMILTRAFTYYFGLFLGFISLMILSLKPYQVKKSIEEFHEEEVPD